MATAPFSSTTSAPSATLGLTDADFAGLVVRRDGVDRASLTRLAVGGRFSEAWGAALDGTARKRLGPSQSACSPASEALKRSRLDTTRLLTSLSIPLFTLRLGHNRVTGNSTLQPIALALAAAARGLDGRGAQRPVARQGSDGDPRR